MPGAPGPSRAVSREADCSRSSAGAAPPAVVVVENDEAFPRGRLRILALCFLYIGTSGALIRYNKFLIHPDRFPYPIALSTLHTLSSLVLSFSLYMLNPSLFPTATAAIRQREDLLKWFVPISFCFAVSLVASNEAYMYCSVTFLQFMKEANVIFTFLISCAVGLQVMNRVKVAVILWIIIGSSLCVAHELHFVLAGFTMQALSQLAECTRVVLGEMVMSGSSLKLDPLTYTLFASPFSLAMLLLGDAITWQSAIVQRAITWWPYLVPNMCLAFCLNLLVAIIIKDCSAVGFILTGVVKDVVLVIVSAVAFREPVTRVQALSFTMVLGGVLFWSLMRAAPKHPLVTLIERAMGFTPEGAAVHEKTPLVARKDSLLAKV